MKNIYWIICCCLLSSCVSPEKLLESGRNEAAIQHCMKRLSRKKVDLEDISVLETAQRRLASRDSQAFQQLLAEHDPGLWARIHREAIWVQARQERLKRLEAKLESRGYNMELKYYPVDDLVATSQNNAALYHYALAQEHIPAARSGDRFAARKAWASLKECRTFLDDFRDSPELQEEMYQLGLTHVNVSIGQGAMPDDFAAQYGDILFSKLTFPIQDDWLIIHHNRGEQQTTHYDMIFSFEQATVGPNLESTNSCFTQAEVENGFIIKEVWSEEDSAYVQIKEIQYITVCATVTTIQQYKSASISVAMRLIDRTTGEFIKTDLINHTEEWTNAYHILAGDSRALQGSNCPCPGGGWSYYPSGQALIRLGMNAYRWKIKRMVARQLPKMIDD